MPAISGQSIVVTGGSRGLGLSLVKGLLARHNKVVATARSKKASQNLQKLQEIHGDALVVTELDVDDNDSIKQWAADLKLHLDHVDVLINNAGIYGRRVSMLEWEPEDFLATFRTNAMGPFFVSQNLVKQGLLGPPQSLVVNISSIVGSIGDTTMDSARGYPYRASKCALNMIQKLMVLDLADMAVQCVAIHPGYVATDMTSYQGTVAADDSAAGVLQVLEGDLPLNNKFYTYQGLELPW